MKSTNPHCLIRSGSSLNERAPSNSSPIDSGTTQAFHQLRTHAEEIALELAVRLRVLGKSLMAACPDPETKDGTESLIAYTNIRRQLDGFFCSLIDGDFAGHHFFPIIRDYLLDSLPVEPSGCGGGASCRVELIESMISLLSESPCEHDAFTKGLVPALTF